MYAVSCDSNGLLKLAPDSTLQNGQFLSAAVLQQSNVVLAPPPGIGVPMLKMTFAVSSNVKIKQQLRPYNERFAQILTAMNHEEAIVKYENVGSHHAADDVKVPGMMSDDSQYTETATNVTVASNGIQESVVVAREPMNLDANRPFKSDEAFRVNEEVGIREVWNHNLEEEFRVLRNVIQQYKYVAMDTEFPGVVARPIGEFRSSSDYHYQMLRCNVDLLDIIQLGLTFMDESGNTPPGISTWQFNFKFNLDENMYAQDSIDMLQKAGIQFKRHLQDGIEPFDFAELLMSSGIVLMENVKWLTFHSGYDFGYLLKLLTASRLPIEASEFFELLKMYFPNIYDIKCLMRSIKELKGGLQEVAEQLKIARIGPQHQAGSDALLTGRTFFKLRAYFVRRKLDFEKHHGQLYGLCGQDKTTEAVTNTNAND